MKRTLSRFFVFTKTEQRGIITLLLLSVVILIFPRAFHYFSPPTIRQPSAAFLEQVSELETAYEVAKQHSNKSIASSVYTLHFFDPNQLNQDDWKALGLSEKQAISIEKFKSKGGRFYKPEDIRKLYALTPSQKEKLLPYVRIAETETMNKSNRGASRLSNDSVHHSFQPSSRYAVAATRAGHLDINTADSAAFEHLRGIGPTIASRIIAYRSALGGFVAIKQLKEVYGIRDSVYEMIRPQLTVNRDSIRPIYLNRADYETLRKHPYIKGWIAKWMLSYRKNNGDFHQPEEVLRITGVNDSIFRKMLPYLRTD
ncbi:MAG: helix-hairpin-helix domain-containing protein [Chitinophagales bacterium]